MRESMDYIIHTTHGDELYHHGIIGQKWGVRRYQNPDGTLTSAGKAKLQKKIDKNSSATKYAIKSTKGTLGENKKALADIKKNGAKSKYVADEYKRRVEEDKDEAEEYHNQAKEAIENGDFAGYARANSDLQKHNSRVLNDTLVGDRYKKSAIAKSLAEEYQGKVDDGKAELKKLNERNKHLSSMSVESLSDSGVGYKEAKRIIKEKGTTWRFLY